MCDKRRKAYGQIVNFGFRLGFIPYQFKFKNCVNVKSNSKCPTNLPLTFHKHRVWKMSWCLVELLLSQLFLFFRAYQISLDKERPRISRLRAIYTSLLYFLLNFNHWVMIRYFGHHHRVINAFFCITQQLKRNLNAMGKTRRATRAGDRLLPVLLSVTCVAFIFISAWRALKVFYRPESPELFTSLFKNPETLSLWARTAFGFTHFYITIFHLYTMVFNMASVFCYASAILETIRLTKIERSQEVGGGSLTGDECSTIYKSYQQLRVLQNYFGTAYSIWTLGFGLTGIFVAVVQSFLALTPQTGRGHAKEQFVALTLAIVILLITLLFMSRLAQVHSHSSMAIESWRMASFPLWFRKFQRAARPVSVKIGSSFYADRHLITTLFYIVSTYTANLTLVFKGVIHS